MDIITKYKGGVILKPVQKVIIVLSCIILICGACFYMYYSTLDKAGKGGNANLKPNTISDSTASGGSDLVSKTPAEDTVTPNTVLRRIAVSESTGKTKDEYKGIVPDNLVNMTKDEVVNFYKSVDPNMKVTEFSKDEVDVVRYTSYLPNCYLVRIEENDIVVYTTDDDGVPHKYEKFTPRPCKNKDELIEKGIEVESEEDVNTTIGDYD